jgi:hypothetical protein
VLIVHSFGPNFAPFDEFASGLKRELARISPAPVEYFEASIETARFGGNRTEAPLAAYLSALFAERGIDLVVSVGGPAARFCVTQRERLFPETPLLIAGIETRIVPDAPKRMGCLRSRAVRSVGEAASPGSSRGASSRNRGPVARIIARSTAFRSSRRLPATRTR